MPRTSGRRGMRLAGWMAAANALAVLVAVSLGGTARDAAAQFALWCGIG